MYVVKDNLKLYIFDFCGTLYNGNTSLLFLGYINHHAHFTYKLKYLFYWLIAKILKDFNFIGGNDYMKIRIKTLKGMNINDLNNLAIKFYDDVLNHIEIKETFELLNSLIRSKRKNIIILSNTFDFILEYFPLKDQLKKVLGSELNTKNLIVQGKYKKHVNQIGKLNIMHEYFDEEEIKNSMFITDNLASDYDLFNYVDQPILSVK